MSQSKQTGQVYQKSHVESTTSDNENAGTDGGLRFHSVDMGAIGAEIRRRRLARNLTLQQAAGEANITHGYLSMVENGRRAPTIESLDKIVSVVGGHLHMVVTPSAASVTKAPRLREKDVALLERIAKVLPDIDDEEEREMMVRGLEIAADRERTEREARELEARRASRRK